MTRKREDSLSELARQLLVAERSVVEAEPLKARAMARARDAMQAGRLSRVSWRASLGASAWRGLLRLPRVGLAAAALAGAGLAAAGAGLLAEQSPDAPPRPTLVSVPKRPPSAPPVVRAEAHRAAPLPTAPSATPSASPLRPSSLAAAPHTAGSSKRSDTPVRASSARQYALELEVLAPARQAIARGEYGAALEAAARHEQSFPSGQLAEERAALRVRALWGSGRRAEARAEAALFGKRYPRSGLLAWMRDAPVTPP